MNRPFETVIHAIILILSVGAAQASSPTLEKVTLTQGGVAFYEFEAEPDARGRVTFDVPRNQLDDFLKSLVVLDGSARVISAGLAGEAPMDQVFGRLPLDASAFDSLDALLRSLRGERVSLTTDKVLEGRILSVDPVIEGNNAAAVALRVNGAILRIPMNEIQSVSLADKALDGAIMAGLDAYQENQTGGMRRVTVNLAGAKDGAVAFAYVAAAPVWKSVYRLTLDGNKGALQGWAVFENFSGQDWQGVDLTLSSGNPVTYRQALYRAFFPSRPEIPVVAFDQLAPPVDEGVMEEAAYARSPVMADMVFGEARPVAKGNAASGVVPAMETATEIRLHLGSDIDLGSGRTLTMPIISGELPVQSVTYLAMNDEQPYAAFHIENKGKTTLPPGLVTVYGRANGNALYAGDARLGVVPPGEDRLLAYAADLKVKADRRQTSSTAVAEASIADGVLRVTERVYHTLRVDLHLSKGESRSMVVDFPVPDHWALISSAKAAQKIRNGYRVSRTVDAGDKGLVEARFAEERGRRFALINTDVPVLEQYVSGEAISGKLQQALKQVVDLKKQVSEARGVLKVAEARLETTRLTEERTRENLKAVGQDPLRQQYLDKLVAAEAAVERAASDREQADARLRQSEAELNRFISNLNIES